MNDPEQSHQTLNNITTGFDLPDYARCPHCNYRLQGLTEPRCPECGTPFDPDIISNSFTAKWLQLLLWYLTAVVVSKWLMVYYFIKDLLGWFSGPNKDPFYSMIQVVWCADLLLFCILLPVAMVGLHRRREWGRKTCIAILLIVASLGPLVVVINLLFIDFFAPVTFDLKLRLGLIIPTLTGKTLPSIALLIFLTTGLRRYSLATDSDRPPPPLSLERFHQRSDWLLLAVVLLAIMALDQIAQIVPVSMFHIVDTMWPDLSTISLNLVTMALRVLAIIGATIGAWRVWRKPETLRRVVLILFCLTVTATILGIASILLQGFQYTGEIRRMYAAYWISWGIGSNLPYLALLLFTFKALDREDFQIVSQPRE